VPPSPTCPPAISVPYPFYETLDPETGEFERSYFDDALRREYSEEYDAELVVHSRTVGEWHGALVDAGFGVTGVREPGYADPDEYDNDALSYDPDLMATVPATILFEARA